MKTNNSRMSTPIKTSQGLPLTPLEKLLSDKRNLEVECNIREKKLKEDVEYIQCNASSLIFSSLASLFFSAVTSKRKPKPLAQHNDTQPTKNSGLLSVSNIFEIGQKLIPFVWEIVQPILIDWGITKTKSLLIGLFTKKKSAQPEN